MQIHTDFHTDIPKDSYWFTDWHFFLKIQLLLYTCTYNPIAKIGLKWSLGEGAFSNPELSNYMWLITVFTSDLLENLSGWSNDCNFLKVLAKSSVFKLYCDDRPSTSK